MPKTAEQILKEQGLTDAEIAAYSTLLADPRHRAAIENPFNKLEGDRDQLMARNREWEEFETQAKATIATAEQDAMKARREAADYQEQIRIAKDYGYFGAEAEEKAKQALEEKRRQEAANAPRGFDSADPKFVEFATDYSRFYLRRVPDSQWRLNKRICRPRRKSRADRTPSGIAGRRKGYRQIRGREIRLAGEALRYGSEAQGRLRREAPQRGRTALCSRARDKPDDEYTDAIAQPVCGNERPRRKAAVGITEPARRPSSPGTRQRNQIAAR